jgi:hypothetical protein
MKGRKIMCVIVTGLLRLERDAGGQTGIVCVTREFDATGSTAAIVTQRLLACWRALVLEKVEVSEVAATAPGDGFGGYACRWSKAQEGRPFVGAKRK